MFDNDNDFSIENILKAAQNGQADEQKKPKADKIRPISANHEHKAPHALTPEEVLRFTEPQKPSTPLPDFDAISKSLNFVVFENDIDPDRSETPQVDFGKSVEKEEPPKAVESVKAEEPKAPAEPAKAVPAPAPKADVKPAAPTGGTLYERMKNLHAARTTTPVPQTSPVSDTLEPSAPKSAPAPVKPVEFPAPPAAEKPAPVEVKPAPVQKPKPIEEIKMTPPRPVARRGAASLSVEEIIKSAEKLAATKAQGKYGTTTIPTPNAVVPSSAKTESKPESPAPVSDQVDLPTDPIEKTIETAPERKIEPTVEPQNIESNSGAALPRTGVKVTPVKRSRVFRTPTDGGVTTHATKVVAKEVPVKIDVIDRSLTTPPTDDRIKEHNPYASQYSLADADLPGKGQLFATQQIDKLSDLFEDEKEIVSSADGASEKTIQFDPLKPLDDDAIEIKTDAPEQREAWEDDLESSRRTKARAFKLFGAISPEEEPLNTPSDAPSDDEPTSKSEEPEEPELTDYETVADAQSILDHLNGKIGKVLIRLFSTTLITLVLFIGALPMVEALRTQNNLLFCLSHLLLLILATVINLPTVKGLASLFALRPDTDSPAALAVCGALIQTLYVCISGSDGALLTALGGLALIFNLIGKLTMLSSIKGNFRMIADEDEKKSVVLIDDLQVATPIASGAVLGEAFIVAGRKIKNATAFLFNSFAPDPYEKPLGKIILLTLAAAIGGAVVGILGGDLDLAFRLFAAILILGCPITSALLANLPMKLANKRLNRLGAELTGFAPAKEISYANALALETTDLFPAGTVKLYNMHILAPNPVDRSILEAAAVATHAGSPIAPIFTEMNHENLPLPEVDTVHYEDKMGLSGWIGDKRIFIGNRTLMTAHNISGLPSLDIDKRILRSGYFPVYLATTEGPCALFIIGYEADEEISTQLRRLTQEGVTLLIDSCDQNVTEEMIYDYFDLHDDSIKLLAPQTAKLYKEQVVPATSEPSFAVCKSDAAGLAAILSASIRLNRIYNFSLVLHILLLVAGFAMVLATGYTGTVAWITAIGLGIYQLVTGLVTLVFSLIYRP